MAGSWWDQDESEWEQQFWQGYEDFRRYVFAMVLAILVFVVAFLVVT